MRLTPMATGFIEQLMQRGWRHVASSVATSVVPSRYFSVPEEIRHFIASFDVLCNENETQWLVSAADFQRPQSEGFGCNEFEQISLLAAEGDLGWQQRIKSFWDAHLPIFMRVDGAYAYAAYCCSGSNAGSFVSGYEPEFEEISVVGRTLAEFQTWLLHETDA